jgi:hypothetical protein
VNGETEPRLLCPSKLLCTFTFTFNTVVAEGFSGAAVSLNMWDLSPVSSIGAVQLNRLQMRASVVSYAPSTGSVTWQAQSQWDHPNPIPPGSDNHQFAVNVTLILVNNATSRFTNFSFSRSFSTSASNISTVPMLGVRTAGQIFMRPFLRGFSFALPTAPPKTWVDLGSVGIILTFGTNPTSTVTADIDTVVFDSSAPGVTQASFLVTGFTPVSSSYNQLGGAPQSNLFMGMVDFLVKFNPAGHQAVNGLGAGLLSPVITPTPPNLSFQHFWRLSAGASTFDGSQRLWNYNF